MLQKHLKTELPSILGIALLVLAFPPFDLWPLVFFGLVPVFYRCSEIRSSGEAWRVGFLLSFLYTLGGFYWVAHAINHFGNVPMPLSVVLLFLFGFIGQPQFIGFPYLYYKLKESQALERAPLLSFLFLAFSYVSLDSFLPKLFLDSLGHSTYLSPSFRQLAAVGSVSLITFIIFSSSYGLFCALQSLVHKRRIWNRVSLITCVFFIFGFLIGRYEHLRATPSPSSEKIRASLIQGNIGDFEKVAARSGASKAAFEVLDIFIELSKKAMSQTPRPDFIVWPETTYPSTYRKPMSQIDWRLDEVLTDFVKTTKTPIVFGGYDTNRLQDFNAVFMLTPFRSEGEDLQTYQKSILLPFGEYIPILDQIPAIRKLFPQMGFFGRGPGPSVYELEIQPGKSIPLTPIICYEALFSGFSIEAARKGSKVLVNVTNDSWFGPYSEPFQHFALSAFRSIETRLPQLRSTNTGITALIEANGNIVAQTGIFEKTIATVEFSTDPLPRPLVMILGPWWFSIFCLLGVVTLVLVDHFTKRIRLWTKVRVSGP